MKVLSREEIIRRSPKCPKCGAHMVKRTAKRGPYAGNEFWGCSNYPKCREIINIDDVTDDNMDARGDDIANNSDGPIIDFEAPTTNVKEDFVVTYQAKPYEGFDAMESFQSIGCSKPVMESVNGNSSFANAMLDISKFRVDYIETPECKLTGQQRRICALLMRNLCRGRITYISPYVERKISELFAKEDEETEADVRLSQAVFNRRIPYCYDSHRERAFAESVFGTIFGTGWEKYVDTQVMVKSLCENREPVNEQRIDFLVTNAETKCIIELDGDEHKLHIKKDEMRDADLAKMGYIVRRISNEEIDSNLDELRQKLAKEISFESAICDASDVNRRAIEIAVFKLVHQAQIAIVSGIYRGTIDPAERLSIAADSDIISEDTIIAIGKVLIEDLKQQFRAICALYQVDEFFCCEYDKAAIGCISFQTDKAGSHLIKAMISDINCIGTISNNIPYYSNLEIKFYDEALLTYYLEFFFRHKQFREGQLDGITRLLSGQDSIILLPTGSGKSVIYQLAAMLSPGKTIIVSPLVSLMHDQVENLQWNGIECAVAISSQNRDVGEIINNPANVMIYLSPERLQLRSFRDEIELIQVNNSICSIAIDEAHCVSEWGHDFRTAYLNIGRTARRIFNFYGKAPTIIALTGTASTAVLKDVKRELEITDHDAVITPETFDRPELTFRIVSAKNDKKIEILSKMLEGVVPFFFDKTKVEFYKLNGAKTNGGIIFCPHVNGDFGVANVMESVRRDGISTNLYCGSAPKFYSGNWDAEKAEIAKSFKRNNISVLVATKAFGMGIDKPNVAFTIHYGIPGSIESFYQEAGRAARGEDMKALCAILLSDDNVNENSYLLSPSTPLEEVKEVISGKTAETADDISRMMFFHVQAFKGIDYELEIVKSIVDAIYMDADTLTAQRTIIQCDNDSNMSLNSAQKAIQRLLVLGVIQDYTISYSSSEITLLIGSDEAEEIRTKYATYVKGYNEGRIESELQRMGDERDSRSKKDFVIHAAKVLTEFIYDTIEKGRRRGLSEMRKAAQAAKESKNPDAVLRDRVIRYFETTYSDQLYELIEDKNLGFAIIPKVLDGEEVTESGLITGGVRSPNEAAGLRGGTSRFLESTPDHPGLLMLRALAELHCKEHNKESIIQDVKTACDFAIKLYSRTKDDISSILQYFVEKVLEIDCTLYEPALDALAEYIDKESINAHILDNRRISEELKIIPARMYFSNVAERVITQIAEGKGE